MLLNWTTIDACFLFPTFHIHSTFTFFLTCLGSFLLVISLEFLRRLQREFDRYLRTRKLTRTEKEYVLPEEMEEKLLDKGTGVEASKGTAGKERPVVVMEQVLRGLVHMVQFSVSYCIMLLFMYSNGMTPSVDACEGKVVLTGDRLCYRIYCIWGFGGVCVVYERYLAFTD